MAKVLIIDDDESMCYALARAVKRMGHEATTTGTLAAGLNMVQSQDFDTVFLDVYLPDGNGLTILSDLTQTQSRPEVIIVTGQGEPDGAELAITNGAWDYIEKTNSIQHISLTLKRALEHHSQRKKEKKTTIKVLRRENIIGDSGALGKALDTVAQSSECDANVLITGETGTGKELFAKAIHLNSERATGPFVVVDCAALPQNIVESILFGHEKGAFTGAEKEQLGLVLEADGGTLFLDEVAEMSLDLQKSFLRLLQERTVRPLGSKVEKKSNFRLISATNRNPDKMVYSKMFREDLLFRIRSISLHLPPLRERKGDIEGLARHFIAEICNKNGIETKGVSSDFFEILEEYKWPGNIRELIHTIEHAIAASKWAPSLFAQHLPPLMRAKIARTRMLGSVGEDPLELPEFIDSSEALPSLQTFRDGVYSKAELFYLKKLMNSTKGDIKEAISIASVSQSRLYALLKKHGLQLK